MHRRNDPFYCGESPETCRYILGEYLAPALLVGNISGDPFTFYDEVSFIRGNNMAKAALEAALWDLKAQKEGKPLHKLFGGIRETLFTGVSVGIQESVEKLVDVVGKYKEAGYRRIKIKIKHGWDVEPVKALREAYGDIPLMVDANCAYTTADTEILQELDQFDLMMIEQPLGHDDVFEHARLQAKLSTPICLDESIDSVGSLQAALALNACRIVNIKQGRVGGPVQAMVVHDLCKKAGIPVWAGGMLETGVGRSLNIALATKENFEIPGDISASNRYWAEDIIEPEVEMSEAGELALPEKAEEGLRSGRIW
jgi:O-succinylbenzoate synthase